MKDNTILKVSLYVGGSILAIGVGYASFKAIQKARFSAQGKREGSERMGEDVVGKTLNVGEAGYVKIRRTPEIPNSIENCAWYDAICWGAKTSSYLMEGSDVNVIGKVTQSPIGEIKQVVKGKDGWNWYKVEYSKIEQYSSGGGLLGGAITGAGGKSTGYVREDVVNVNY